MSQHSLVDAVPHCAKHDLSQIIDCHRYNNFTRLLRITAYVLRFVSNLRRSLAERTVNELTSLEIEQAQNRWIKNIEVKSFWQRNRILKEDNATNLCTAQFGLYLDDNQIIRCKGRLNKSSLSDSTKNPTIFALQTSHHNLVDSRTCPCPPQRINTTLSSLRENTGLYENERRWKVTYARVFYARKSKASRINQETPLTYQKHPWLTRNTPDLPETPLTYQKQEYPKNLHQYIYIYILV